MEMQLTSWQVAWHKGDKTNQIVRLLNQDSKFVFFYTFKMWRQHYIVIVIYF